MNPFHSGVIWQGIQWQLRIYGHVPTVKWFTLWHYYQAKEENNDLMFSLYKISYGSGT